MPGEACIEAVTTNAMFTSVAEANDGGESEDDGVD